MLQEENQLTKFIRVFAAFHCQLHISVKLVPEDEITQELNSQISKQYSRGFVPLALATFSHMQRLNGSRVRHFNFERKRLFRGYTN